jgi:hypothetical protein
MQHPPGARVQPSTVVTFNVQTTDGDNAVRGAYVEKHWLPVLGPTCYLLARHVIVGGDGVTSYTYGDLAAALGVSPVKVRDAVKRLRRFGPVTDTDGVITIPTKWPEAPAPLDWSVLR